MLQKAKDMLEERGMINGGLSRNDFFSRFVQKVRVKVSSSSTTDLKVIVH